MNKNLDLSNANGLDNSFLNFIPFGSQPTPPSVPSWVIGSRPTSPSVPSWVIGSRPTSPSVPSWVIGSQPQSSSMPSIFKTPQQVQMENMKAKAEAEAKAKSEADAKAKAEADAKAKAEAEKQKDTLDLSKLVSETSTTPSTATKDSTKTTSVETKIEDNQPKKFLGMPRKVGITLTIVGSLALIVGGIVLVKKLRN
jgi:hypothetical protein